MMEQEVYSQHVLRFAKVRTDDSNRKSRISIYQGLQWLEEMMVAGGQEAACIKICNGQNRWY